MWIRLWIIIGYTVKYLWKKEKETIIHSLQKKYKKENCV